MDFMFNRATHGPGRFHLVENLQIEQVAEEARTVVNEVIAWQKPTNRAELQEGVEYYDFAKRYPASNYRDQERDTLYPILGRVTAILVTPAHMIVKGDAVCGLGRIKSTSIERRDYYGTVKARKYIGKTIRVQTHRVIDDPVVSGDVAPDPLCGHCAKKLDATFVEVIG